MSRRAAAVAASAKIAENETQSRRKASTSSASATNDQAVPVTVTATARSSRRSPKAASSVSEHVEQPKTNGTAKQSRTKKAADIVLSEEESGHEEEVATEKANGKRTKSSNGANKKTASPK